ncbi:MAG: nitroreductase [Gammaproteobacteria bacterium]|uniref:nitroreductase n=1 Tax=Rhodoferax sp. TaxID=50421 RepID=UPI0017C05E8B|nr:nitroreductase [Rhodoferax sp.]MBU3900992.1 nitroreductase [Gammaproteobacteria bacterium]MBA3058316.1 nitroreductase [Rhodoferax sp.]MBU3996779.1 nitroreductase [Gammaproteobacteria bacterium]MBU4017666.1 nitroreductase [Gammaproteobacteria bacterium]MBU4081109.1 nitroreductase [Gammaproteobacteria bacterium]
MTSISLDAADVSAALVDAAITSRMSARAFTQAPVSRQTLTDLLQVASRAPSGTNTQPWKVYVLQGESRAALCEQVCAAHDAVRASPALLSEYREEYDYYPEKWVSPYIDRRRENGWGLYNLLGIGKGDKDKMHLQHQRNYRFFDAPVGLMFTLDRVMGRGSLLDYGMFLQNIMVAARARGLHTCPQAAWNGFAKIILPHIGAQADEMLVCGMALGYADGDDVVNTFHTPRAAVAEFTHWLA